MNNRKIIPAKLLAMALAALSYCTAHAQQVSTNIPTTYVYPLSAANTNETGFIWNVSQVVATDPGNIPFAEAELVGDEGTNFADPSQVYSSAAEPATVPTNALLPITFIIESDDTTNGINFNQVVPGNTGRSDLPLEGGIVGTPGLDSVGEDNIAAEALTYLYLPVGPITMGVRSDDGFQVQIGAANPGDRYSTNATIVEFYNGGRGAADSIVTFNVAEAGLYAARLLYYQGGGDASVEWYSFPPAGTTNTSDPSLLNGLNTGTNAVLIGDVVDSGIAAFQSITAANKGSYVSSLSPAPGETGLSLFPTITATFVNGTVPVKDITLSIDGTSVDATVETTTNGAIATYTVTNLLANISPHTLTLGWNDNGNPMAINSTFSTFGYVPLNASQIVTPDTTKPGFKFNVFANLSDPFAANNSSLGVQAGESDFLDNTELGLNGLLPDGAGGFLPNMVTLANNGAAVAAAPALGGPAAPAEFLITNTVALTGANMPGFPAQDGADPSHSEVLTYVTLPAGLTTFTVTIDGYYRAFMGSWDYTSGLQVGPIYLPVTGPNTFSVYAPVAGTYPLRVTMFNTDGTPQESITAQPLGGTNALLNDLAHGGLPAYYALSTPSKPYVRYASPRPVPHQMLYPNNRVLVRIQDSDTTVNDSSVAFTLDGSSVTVTNDRVGDVHETTWTATTLQTPAEIHTGLLTFKDSGGSSISEQWTFQNLKAVFLPTAQEGYYIPTNAVVIEDFSEYTDPTEFTNGSPTTAMVIGAPAGQWYKSPQPENPLVDVAPIWTNVPAGPTNWFVWNWDADEGSPFDTEFDVTAPRSLAYANFLCVDLNTFSQNLESSSANTAPFEMINGQPLVALIENSGQNILMAESDNRASTLVQGQTQFAMSKQFDLSGVTNPVLAFASLKKQNQDDLGAVEYSIDGGATWAPVIYYLDGHSVGDTGDGEDLQINPDATVNLNNTLFHDQNVEVPEWYDSTGDFNDPSGTSYAPGIASPITQALIPFFAPRINDDNYSGMRVEVVRLPLAAHQSNVRLRLCQLGTCSWYFGVANIAIYDVAPSGAVVPTGIPAAVSSGATLSITTSAGNVNVTWTGSGTLQSAPILTGKASDWSNVTPAPTGTSYTAPIGSGALYFRLAN